MPDGVQSFEFKPAVLAGRNHWTLDGGFLTRNGELYCDLGAVESARFAEMSSSRIYAAWLDLHHEGGRHRIGCNVRRPDENNRQFMSLSAAILDELAERKPDMKVAFGAGGGGVGWAFFIMGVLMVVGAVAFVIGEIMMDAPLAEILWSFLFCAMFAGFGALMAVNFRPWVPAATLPPASARDVVAKLAVNDQPSAREQDGE